MQQSTTKKLFFVFLCSMLLGSLPCFSTTYYSIANGSWALATTWSLSAGGAAATTLPATGDDVVICTGTTVDITANKFITNVTLNGSGTLSFNTSSLLFVLGNLTMNNTSAITGNGADRGIVVTGNFFGTAGANITIQNVRFNIGGTFNNANAATLTLNTGKTASKTFRNFINNGTWTNTDQNVPITISGNFVNNGTFNQGTGDVTFTGATSNTISGTAPLTTFDAILVSKGTSGTVADQNNILDVQSIIALGSGKLFLTRGTFKLSSASTIVPFSATNRVILSSARLWNNGGTINSTTSFNDWLLAGTLQNSAGTITVGVAAEQSIRTSPSSAVVISGGDVKVAGCLHVSDPSSSYTMSGGTLTVNVLGLIELAPFAVSYNCSFTMTGGRIIIANASTGSANFGFANNGTSGGGFTGGTLQIGTTSTPAVTGNMRLESIRPIYNLEVVGAYTTALITTTPGSLIPTALTITNDLTITAGVLDIETGATDPFGVGTGMDLFIGGNWTSLSDATDPFIEGTKKVTFNGTTGTQTISSSGLGAVNGTTFYDLTIANTSLTVPQVKTTANVVVRNTLTLTRGKVNLSGNTLTLGTSSTANGTLVFPTFNPTAAVQPTTWMYGGTFKRFFSTTALPIRNIAGLFPLGSETDYHPFWLNYSTALTTGGAFSVTHDPSAPGSDPIPNYLDASCGLTIEGISKASWVLSSTLNASGNPFGISYGGFGFANFLATDLNASLATNTVGTCNGVTETPGIYFDVSRKNLLSGDINKVSWYIGTSNLSTSPLPIELLSFEAYMVDTTVNIKWSTATETNCDYFLVERSIDGIDWKTIDKVTANGTSTMVHVYNTTDPTAAFGYNYYRLKEVDYNGPFEISPMKSVYKPTKIKEVYKYINALGQQITNINNYTGLYFILYTDGVVEKRIQK